MEYEEVKPSFWSLKNVFIIFIIIFVLAIVGVLIWFFAFKDASEINVIRELSDESIENSFLESCLNNCGSCEQNCKDSDLLQRAENGVDESLCNNILNEGLKQECIFSVTLVKAIDSKDKSLCDSIINEDEKEMCINAVEYSLNPTEIQEDLE